ncbi:MAG: response regulator [Verrucomicrobiota bacterium]|jgi:DNA-binding response OmpR family regulator
MTPNLTIKPNVAKALTREAPVPGSKVEAVKKTILVVDDDSQIRDSLRKVLREEGYGVVLAADGREGVERFNKDRIDLLLLDVNLPDMSGWDVFGSVISLDPFVPILIITGRTDQIEIVRLSGVGALIEKPFNVPMLLQTIAEKLAEPPEAHLKRLMRFNRQVLHVQPAEPN